MYGKAEGPFHPKGPAGGWCGTGSGELWIFLPRNRIVCQVENSLYLDRGSLMNASSTELHRKIRRTAGRASKRGGGMRSGGVQNAAEKGRRNEKNWKPSRTFGSLVTLLNPTKPPKNSLEKLGAKHATFGEAWKKAWRAPLFRHRWLPPTSGLRSSGIVTARSEATKQPVGSVTRPLGCFAALVVRPRKAA